MAAHPSRRRDPELLAEHVLRCVESIPAGQIATYGDVGKVVGVGPRQVGRLLAGSGDVPWWRVTNARGELPAPLLPTALERWTSEGITPAPSGRGCHLATHRVDRERLARTYAEAVAPLPPLTAS